MVICSDFGPMNSAGVIILVGEVDGQFAFLCDQHRRPDHIEFFRLQRRDDSVPGHFDDGAVGLHLGTDRIHEIDFKTDPFA